ncbi:sensor domain-containing diguanylate cyclase [Pectinatus haikarae]|uniref:Diguanylate cyclase (GGDEF)-like protein n=1 Tax=Pectinatus haikarae TaxID=349096 RepID=A0ABT9Y6N9_9FIRM|nr:diguanylate cyclase [Pectinatus haikarae]MDQ0203394.1 diguanylate cyclase (GGDEF)-like protein [Pectinatus haikarae]
MKYCKNEKNFIEVGGEFITLKQLIETIPVTVVLIDRKGNCISNGQFLVDCNATSKKDSLVESEITDLNEKVRENIKRDFELFDQGKNMPAHELTLNGRIYKVVVVPLRNISGFAFAELAVLTDISENKNAEYRLAKLNEQLKVMVSRDGLTKLLNKNAFREVCNKLIKVALREMQSFSVMFIDIDYFKKVNDTYGHSVGDMVLRKVAESIVKNCRKSDIVGRVGGEEIAVYLPNTNCYGAVVLAEKIRTCIEKSEFRTENIVVRVTVSIGVSANKPYHKTISDIKKDADKAMYMAKSNGRNRVECLYE